MSAIVVDQTNANTALASALVEELGRSGVERAVICPGSRSTPVALALLRAPAIATTTIVDERSAAFFALGAAAATNHPVAIVCTSGTAAANFHPAVCEADQSGLPLILLTCDRPPELRDIGAGQTIDQIGLYGSAVRWFCEVGTHDADDAGLLQMRAVACRAAAVAAGDPAPGPVQLNLSWRDPLGPEPIAGAVTAGTALALAGRSPAPLTAVIRDPIPAAPDVLIAELAHLAATATRPLICCGRMASSEASAAIAALAARIGAPIVAEPTSQLRFGRHDRSHVIATYDAIANLRPPALVPDLVLRFGELPTSKATRGWLAELDAIQVAVDPRAGRWHDPSRAVSRLIRAEPAALAETLTSSIGAERAPGTDWLRDWIDAAGANEAVLASAAIPPEAGLQRLLGGAYADGELVYTASSLAIRDQEAFAGSGEADLRFLANRGANGIDGLVSSGIGAAVASGRPTWIVTGELGLHHDSNALALVRHAPAPVRIVVINNGGGGIFEQLPQADQVSRDEFEAILGTPLEVNISALAAAHGIEHRLLTPTAAELGGATQSCLLELRCDRRESAELRRRLATETAAAIRRSLAA